MCCQEIPLRRVQARPQHQTTALAALAPLHCRQAVSRIAAGLSLALSGLQDCTHSTGSTPVLDNEEGSRGQGRKGDQACHPIASVCVLQRTLDMISNLNCAGKGAKSNCRSQEQAECPQSCMTQEMACASWLLTPLQRMPKEAELSVDSSTPENDCPSKANIFSQKQLPNTIRSRILCTQNQVPCSSSIAQTP